MMAPMKNKKVVRKLSEYHKTAVFLILSPGLNIPLIARILIAT